MSAMSKVKMIFLDSLRSRGSHDEGQTKLLPIRGYRDGRRSASSRCCSPRFSDARLGIKDRGLYEVAERRWLWLASVKASFSAAALSARLQAPRCTRAPEGSSAGGSPRA